MNLDKEILLESLTYPMPFGKYKNVMVCNLPVSYLEWFLNKDGFPKGKLGDMMTMIYQIKLNGLEEIIVKLKKEQGK